MSMRVALGAMFLSAAVAGNAAAQKVTTDWDHSANWSQYNSYYIQMQNNFGDQLAQQRIIKAADSALQSRGWKKVPTIDNASAAVLINGSGQKQQTATTMYTGGGFAGWGWGGGGGGMATTSTQTFTVGTLVVDIFDTKTKQLLFRGQASETLSDKAEKNTSTLYKAMEKMFKDFPPMPKK
jgi:hypothetical protein